MRDPVISPTRLVVLPAEADQRLDQFLAQATALSRRRARVLIDEGAVIRNLRPQRVSSRPVEAGDVVDLVLSTQEVQPRPLPPLVSQVELLFEDRWLVVGYKPAGVLTQPAEGRPELSFDQLILLNLALREGSRPFVRLVHRIDRLTSGAVLFARNPQALKPLTQAWAEGKVERSYSAVVEGQPPGPFEITEPIDRDRSHRWRFQVEDSGKPAHTEVRAVTPCSDHHALVECVLHSGRTHQVRVHLAHAGYPVLGDRLYGGSSPAGIMRPLLHAQSLTLPHPKTGATLHIDAPLPSDMAEFVEAAQTMKQSTGDIP